MNDGIHDVVLVAGCLGILLGLLFVVQGHFVGTGLLVKPSYVEADAIAEGIVFHDGEQLFSRLQLNHGLFVSLVVYVLNSTVKPKMCFPFSAFGSGNAFLRCAGK